MSNPKIAVPTIHMGGSNAESLKREYMQAYHDARVLLKSLEAIELHARDYYVHPDPEAFELARNQSSARYVSVLNIRKELETIIFAIQEQQNERTNVANGSSKRR